ASGLPRGGSAHSALPGDEAALARVFEKSRNAQGGLALERDGWVLRFQLRRLRELARARGVGEPEWGIRIEQPQGEAAAMLRLSRDAVDVLDAGGTREALRDPMLAGPREFWLRRGRSDLRLRRAAQLR